ncbi:DUF4383 domain-containing protein [Streptomyces barkulensis]|uniref:DUF4383 domain-containing protein n=1 Tax=Streptomyces barkulensis TaxID=1257026 RepID=UPI000C6E5A3F|nr:DUF4383 domain-containing protein [Streptomyces barkulensis]
MKIRDELPMDHRLAGVYRYGAAVSGAILLVFGILGFANRLDFFDTTGSEIAGLSSNGLLSLISVTVGTLLIAGAAIGGNLASTLNMTVGVLFILSGFANLALLETSANILAFRMPNVIFSFLMGLVILTFGMYGRISGGLPHDNPYWLRRHPEQAAAEEERRRRLAAAGIGAPGRTPEALGAGGMRGTGPDRPALNRDNHCESARESVRGRA